jgi:hypothetical protein
MNHEPGYLSLKNTKYGNKRFNNPFKTRNSMKRDVLKIMVRSFLVMIMIIMIRGPLFAQQVIKFKDGHREIGKILKQQHDTLYIRLFTSPQYTRVMGKIEIDTILPLFPDSVRKTRSDDYSLILHKKISSGRTKIIVGATFTAIGIIGITSGVIVGMNADNLGAGFGSGALFVFGSASFIAGSIMLLSGSSKMHKYNAQRKSLSFNFKNDARCALALSYKF